MATPHTRARSCIANALCHCELRLYQVYTIVTTALEGSSPPGRTAVCELLDKLQEPVPYLQTLFQPISSRVSQVSGRTAAAPCGPLDQGGRRVRGGLGKINALEAAAVPHEAHPILELEDAHQMQAAKLRGSPKHVLLRKHTGRVR